MQERYSISPNKKDECLKVIDQAFDNWYQKEYWVLQRDFFDKISNVSFLSYLRHILSLTNEAGEFNLEEARVSLQEKMGEYYSEHKLENAVTLIENNDWKALLIQHSGPIILENESTPK